MLIKEIVESDLADILHIERKVFSSPWNQQDFIYEIQQNPFSKLYCLEINQEIVAYIGIWLLGDQGQITTLATKEEHRKKGCAQILIDKAINCCQNENYSHLSLEVRVSNLVAINLYQKNGFEIKATRKNYYADNNEDAYLMLKEIGG